MEGWKQGLPLSETGSAGLLTLEGLGLNSDDRHDGCDALREDGGGGCRRRRKREQGQEEWLGCVRHSRRVKVDGAVRCCVGVGFGPIRNDFWIWDLQLPASAKLDPGQKRVCLCVCAPCLCAECVCVCLEFRIPCCWERERGRSMQRGASSVQPAKSIRNCPVRLNFIHH